MYSWMLGQSSTNPFEIRPRLSSVSDQTDETPASHSSAIDGVSHDTLSFSSSVLPTSQTISDNSAEKQINPFDVDHVPFRKVAQSQYTQRRLSRETQLPNNNSFLFWWLLGTVIIWAVVINTRFQVIRNVTRSATNMNILKLFKREEDDKVSPSLWFLYMSYFVNFTVLLYLAGQHWEISMASLRFVHVLGMVTGYYIFRHIGLYFIGWLYNVAENTGMYSFTMMTSHIFIGMALIPLNFILAFGPELMKAFWIIFVVISMAILYFVKILRGILIVSGHIYSQFFQIFIYLCAFECAPLLLWVKFLMNQGVSA